MLSLGLWVALSAAPPFKEITLAELRDKIEGGWAGQMIGVSYGAPTEFRYLEKTIPEKDLPEWAPDKVRNALDQDDLYVDMTFAKVLDDKGINATTEDFGAMFRNAKYRLWHANLAARRALKRGVPAELTGTPKYNIHANDIDFQIEADFIGLMAPGLPQSANEIAERAGKVMNYGDGIYGGMFVSCMYSAAFFDNDPRRVVEAGVACIPAKSPYGLLIADVLAWSKQSTDWIEVWTRLEQKWNKREPCPSGAGSPFNIDAKLNGGYIAIGMLYGKGDIGETIRISTRCGQDSDCNPSSAAGIVGVMTGYRKISDHWKGGITKLADEKFNYTDYSFRTILGRLRFTRRAHQRRRPALDLSRGVERIQARPVLTPEGRAHHRQKGRRSLHRFRRNRRRDRGPLSCNGRQGRDLSGWQAGKHCGCLSRRGCHQRRRERMARFWPEKRQAYPQAVGVG